MDPQQDHAFAFPGWSRIPAVAVEIIRNYPTNGMRLCNGPDRCVASERLMAGSSLVSLGESQPMRKRLKRLMDTAFKPSSRLSLMHLAFVIILGCLLLPGVARTETEQPSSDSGGTRIGAPSSDACRTPLGVPCYTIQYSHSQWQFANRVITGVRGADGRTEIQRKDSFDRIRRVIRRTAVAVRRDGSRVSRTDESRSSDFLGGTFKIGGPSASMYLAPQDQVVSIFYDDGTFSSRPPLIWHDRPYRRSKDGDTTCSSGILHFGTDFHYAGESSVAGIRVARWVRGSWSSTLDEEEDLAPSLDCACLKTRRIYFSRWHLPIFMDSMEATSVQLGEPKSDLFSIPAGYRQVKDPQEQRLRNHIAQSAKYERR